MCAYANERGGKREIERKGLRNREKERERARERARKIKRKEWEGER